MIVDGVIVDVLLPLRQHDLVTQRYPTPIKGKTINAMKRSVPELDDEGTAVTDATTNISLDIAVTTIAIGVLVVVAPPAAVIGTVFGGSLALLKDLCGLGNAWRKFKRKIQKPALTVPPSALSVHEMLVRHPWAIGLLESRKAPGPALLRYAESILDVLRRAGFAPVAAIRAFCVLDSYVYGFSIQQKSLPPDPGSATLAIAEQFLRGLPVHGYPHLAEAASNVMQSGFDFSKEFELGLDLILKALKAWRVG